MYFQNKNKKTPPFDKYSAIVSDDLRFAEEFLTIVILYQNAQRVI